MTRERTSGVYLPALDGVRGLAILMVLAAHYSTVLDRSVPWERITITLCDMGTTGVDLFFVLSGFLITGILLDTRDGPGYFRNFYARRTLRIFPLYYVFLFVQFVPIRGMHEMMQKQAPFSGINPLWYLFYASNLGPTRGVFDFSLGHMWSLAVEEQFYLIWPLVLFLLPRRMVVPLCLAGIGGATALRLGLFIRGTWSETLHRFTPCRIDTLLLGALGAVALRHDGFKAIGSRILRPMALISGLSFVAIEVAYRQLEPKTPIFETFGSGAAAIFYACLVFWAATGGSGDGILNSMPLKMLGKYSYGIYVLHVLLFFQIRDGMSRATLGDRLLNIAANLATTAVLTYVSWVALERPALSLKRYFRYDNDRPELPLEGPRLDGQLAGSN